MNTWVHRPGGVNFGDEVGPHILRALGIDAIPVDRPEMAEVMVTGGSMAMLFGLPVKVIGGGYCREVPVKPSGEIVMVRGPLSAKNAEYEGETADPVCLVTLLPHERSEDYIGVAPQVHFREESPQGELINLRQDPYETVKQIARCKLLYTSSVHAWVAALSLGVPVVRYEAPSVGGEFRWEDVGRGLGVDPSPGIVQIVDLSSKRRFCEEILLSSLS